MFHFLSAPPRRTPMLRPLSLSLSLSLAGFLLALPALALASTVQVAAGQDRWSASVARDWLPRTESALAAGKTLLHDQYDINLNLTQPWVIQASPGSLVDRSEERIVLEAGLTEAELRERALLRPLRVTFDRVFEQMSGGNLRQLPAWLAPALADSLAREAVDSLQLPAPSALEKYVPVWAAARTAHGGVHPAAAHAEYRGARPSPKSRIAMHILRHRLGDGFHRAVKSYLLAIARNDAAPSSLFASQFGISEHELAGLTERQWSMRPVAAMGADSGAKAGGLSAHISVRMGGYVKDDFAAMVERDSLGLVRQATLRFDELIEQLWHVKVGHDVTIYLAAGPDDYRQVLEQDMQTKEQTAEVESEVSGGMSNRRGQIAIKFMPSGKLDKMSEKAVQTTMHELTHQIQYQLAGGKASFRPPRWMMEGPAKLIEYTFAEQMQLSADENKPVYDWRRADLKWWKTGNKTDLMPEDLINTGNGSGWLAMMKEHRGNYEMATLMMLYLKAVSGERFFPSLANYFRLSGQPGENHQRAFDESFGVSESAFLADFKMWLMKQ